MLLTVRATNICQKFVSLTLSNVTKIGRYCYLSVSQCILLQEIFASLKIEIKEIEQVNSREQ